MSEEFGKRGSSVASLVVGQLQLLVDGGISDDLKAVRLQADLIEPL
jgi:hypothetical protein